MTLAPSTFRRRRQPWLGALVVAVLAVAAVLLALVFHNDVVVRSGSSGTVAGSGVAATETRTLPPFTGIELSGSNTVSVRVGAPQTVVVHADTNLLHHVTTTVRSGRLVIGNTQGGVSPKSPFRVDITVPSLKALDLSGSGLVLASGIDAAALTIRLGGSGVIHAAGRASRLDVRLDGSGDAQLDQLVADTVRAAIAGSGRILVRPTTSLNASVPGSGTIVYAGHPEHVTTVVTGSGAVTHA